MKKLLLFGLLLCSILVTFTSGFSNDDAWNDYKVKVNASNNIASHQKLYSLFRSASTREKLHGFPRRWMERPNA